MTEAKLRLIRMGEMDLNVERCREECGSSLVNSKLCVDDIEEGNDKDNNDQEDDLSLTRKYI